MIQQEEIDKRSFEVVTLLETTFKHYLPNVNLGEANLTTPLIEVTKGDLVGTSEALMAVHRELNIKMQYMVMEEFDYFKDLQEVISYFIHFSFMK